MSRPPDSNPDRHDGARHAGHLRGLNLERVLAAVMEQQQPFTRAEIVRVTGLSVPTVGSLTDDLARRGIIRDVGTGPSSGGRRPSFMEFNRRYGFVAGIDIGPTRTRLAVADLRDEVLTRRIVPTVSAGGPADTLGRLAAEVRQMMAETDADTTRLLAVGAAAPGMVDLARGAVILAPNLERWVDVPMRDMLERELGAPVFVDNDVNLAVLGEHWRGAAREHETCVFIFVGTGVGAGILLGGAVHRGHHYMAGEVAEMAMGTEYIGRDFGPRGCFETLAGLEALQARWPRARDRDPATWVGELLLAAENGDGQALEAVRETASFIGMAVANVSTVIDPSMIVLGGAMFDHADVLLREVRRVVRRILPRAPVEIVLSHLGKDAPLTGTLLVAAREARRLVRLRLAERPDKRPRRRPTRATAGRSRPAGSR